MSQISLDYVPTKKQRMFHASRSGEVLYGGAAGGGKSYAIDWDAFIRCLKYPGTNAYLFRRTFPELEQTLIKTMRSIVPESLGQYYAGAHEMRFVNGSTARFCHLSDEGDTIKYQGAEIQWLYFDELTHFSEGMYNYIKTRLRAPKRLGVHPCVRCASNPGGPGHGWVKARFVDSTDVGTHTVVKNTEIMGQDGKMKTKKSVCEYIPATVYDNPHIDEMYIVELQNKPSKLRDALLYGKWDAFEGQAFPEFTNDPAHYADGKNTHVIDPFDIPLNWTRYVSFDHGFSRPFSLGAWAVDPDGRVYRYKELYGCKAGEANVGLMITPGEIAAKMADWLEPEFKEGIHITGIADPAIWDESRGTSVEEQIRKVFNGVIFRKGDNTRMPGKMQLHERLRFGEDGRPMMYVFSTCKDFIRTIPTLCYDEHKVEDIDTAGEDHIYDETRYFLMSRPIAPRLLKPVKKKPVWNPLD